MQYRGIFLDFDYTIGDSTVPIVHGFQSAFQSMGLVAPTAEQVRPTIGMTLMDGYTHITGDEMQEHRDTFYTLFQEAVGELAIQQGRFIMIEKTVLLPGAEELLEALKEQGIKIGIVSTKLGKTIRRIFEIQQISHLSDLVIGAEDVTNPRPDPEGLHKGMKQLGLTPQEVLFCGDTVIDGMAAQRAGCDFAAVLNGTTPGTAFEELPHVQIAADLFALKHWLFTE